MSDKTWFALPSPFPQISVWGCYRGAWQYVMTYNADERRWAVTARLIIGDDDRKTELGWNHLTRAAAEAAVEAHCRTTLS